MDIKHRISYLSEYLLIALKFIFKDPPRQVTAATSSSTVLSDHPRYHVSEEKTNGTKLARLLIDEGTDVLRKVLHTIYPPPTLIAVLHRYKAKLQRLRSKRVIFKNQWEMLFPSSDDPPDTETFDISLLHLLLREICHLTAPSTGWHNMPADDDNSLEANLVRIKCLRNELYHSVSTGITNTEFENKWSKIASSLEALEMSVQRKKYAEKIEALKKDPIDHDVQRRLEEQAKIWEKVREQEKIDTTIFSTRSCLPDRIPEECVFGRNQEIERVKKMAEGGDIPVVLVTGGPGFGKTTVAKRVAHELAKSEKEGTVLFCSLLTKTNFNEVAIEMINSCGTISTQVPENPGQWLRDWSKRVQNQVTFVLDNADSVLESSDRESFISILSDVRKLSRQKVAFVITARKTFENPDLQSCEVRLGPLSAEQARNLLISRVKVYGDAPQNLSRADYIAKNLCGCVPLALCIVGSLLSDYSEETLIESLEKEPLAVLEDDQRSVEKAIKTSFDLLKKPEQETFILLSLFQGPFDIDAVQAVTKAKCSISGALPISILRSLKNRSLVEKPYFRRYQMHPLIQSYAKKIGRDKYDKLLAMGEKLACVHFMLRLANNADSYWGKNTCKDSLVSFQEDKYNFEYFLQIYARGREEQDPEIVNGCELFLDSLPQKCMYLERCLHPRFYTEILERLLKTFDSGIQPVYVVDLLCLVGHEYRKKGEQDKYKEVMDRAEQIRLVSDAAFATKPLSEVYFHNSNARFLSYKKDIKENKRIEEETAMALKISGEQLHDHPERAATLLLSGNISKRSKQFDAAKKLFKEALELFQKSLEKHFMTAETLKATGDLYFFLAAKSEVDFEICLYYYKAALEMFDVLGVGGSKESILTLKNFGICHMKSGNFDEAMNLLSKAEQIAERELEEDHTWKVSIKTSLALLLEKMNYVERAIKVMQEGLVMGKLLNLTIDKMGNKDKLREFLNRYPEKFPETEFPST